MTHLLDDRRERIYLTGFMGSGKSTIGPILANTIGYDFVDLDRSIEAAEGVSIVEIFRTRGQEAFRAMERNQLAHISARHRTVVSLGGGTLSSVESHRIVRASGILVYLKIDPAELFGRLSHRDDRPLLSGPSGERLAPEELRGRIETLYRERAPVYESADLIVVVDRSRIGITVDRVVRALAPFLR